MLSNCKNGINSCVFNMAIRKYLRMYKRVLYNHIQAKLKRKYY